MRSLLILSLSLFLPLAAQAGGKPFWTAKLPGGEYMVSLGSVESLSVHTYMVDGVGQVTEMTVAINSGVVARFYSVSLPNVKMPGGIGQSIVNQAKEKAEEMIKRTGPIDADKLTSTMVVKSYPSTTHAHTVEYRLPSPEAIKTLYDSLKDAWEKRKETEVSVGEPE